MPATLGPLGYGLRKHKSTCLPEPPLVDPPSPPNRSRPLRVPLLMLDSKVHEVEFNAMREAAHEVAESWTSKEQINPAFMDSPDRAEPPLNVNLTGRSCILSGGSTILDPSRQLSSRSLQTRRLLNELSQSTRTIPRHRSPRGSGSYSERAKVPRGSAVGHAIPKEPHTARTRPLTPRKLALQPSTGHTKTSWTKANKRPEPLGLMFHQGVAGKPGGRPRRRRLPKTPPPVDKTLKMPVLQTHTEVSRIMSKYPLDRITSSLLNPSPRQVFRKQLRDASLSMGPMLSQAGQHQCARDNFRVSELYPLN
eukprot:TRINITY_DN4515_c0_g1_i1.p1 TRINITY_DN4515_c0_g1~~TRINITY_DN4515_c0_g1_i1.p1  ORF type:complete len:308 (-),score=14.42 TRINITY_DN4515_c0_g1_i1:229-1152(-)